MRLFSCFLLLIGASIFETSSVHANDSNKRNCTKSQHIAIAIGGVLELNSRIGREQKIAMKMAIHDLCTTTYDDDVCSCPILHIKDSQGNPARIAYEVIDLMKGNQVEAIIGTISPQEATFVAEFDKRTNNIPIISLNPTATSSPQPATLPFYLQMSHDIKIHMQCIAAIVGHFSWRKVTPIYEDHSFFSSSPGVLAQLSDTLKHVDSTIEPSLVFPPLQSLTNPSIYIKTELKKLKMKKNRVFVILKSSVQSCILLFKKANQLGMMEKGYVWIISDDISSLLDSVDQSVILNMQGVIGFKTNFAETSERFTKFKLKFRKDFRINYPNEDEYSNPSLYALRAYDATSVAIKAIKAIQASKGSSSLIKLLQNLTNSKFDGVSGDISFKDGKLGQLPTFRIINVIGRSYRDLEFWSPQYGFSNGKLGSGEGNLDLIYWPGGTQIVPTGQVPRNKGKPLKIGVPARGAFKQFVNVSYDPGKNVTYITGFSIQAFEAAVKKLDYTLSYVFVPYYGSYDDMVAEVHNKTLDAAVGDTEIMAFRYEFAEFSQPYIESGLVVVVPVKVDTTKEWFIFFYAFTTNMWIIILTMTIGTGSIVWFNEHIDENEHFRATSTFEYISKMLWFSISVISLSHREHINNNLSRLALATWFCVNVIIAACFAATLSSIMTISLLQPSLDLHRSNIVVGCNSRSFIVPYLENVLHFKPENIKQIGSIDDYDDAFKKGEIAAAFFVAPHANVFLAKYCRGYKTTGRTYKLGGFGFVFPKGSTLVEDISKAVLKVTQNGDINTLEEDMLRRISNCSRSNQESTDSINRLGPEHFAIMFMLSGVITTYMLFKILVRVVHNHWESIETQSRLIRERIEKWWTLLLLRFRLIDREIGVEMGPVQVVA